MPPDPQEFPLQLSDALRRVLREAREAQGLSLGAAALRSGLNRQAVTFIERGERRPTTETLARLSLALGMRPSEVWAKAEALIPPAQWRKALLLPDPPAGV